MPLAEILAKKLMKTYFNQVLTNEFTMPSVSEVEKKVETLMSCDFDEQKEIDEIKKNRPGWSEDRIYEELDKVEQLKEREFKKEVTENTKICLRKLESMVAMLKSDIESWKEKYTK